jgi:uncharacterized membrane protein YqjE
MAKEPGTGGATGFTGPLGALKNIAVTLLSTLQTRLALLGNEVQMEKRLIAQQLGLGLALVFCLGLGVLLAVALAVQLWWEYRVAVLGVSTALFLALAAYFYAALRRTLTAKDELFSATLAELQEDLRQLKAATRREA